jgi:hypothetical protein
VKARSGAAALTCAILGALSLAAAASAKPGFFVFPEQFSISASLPKSNGYRIDLGSTGHRSIEVFVYGHGETAIYLAKGKANRHGIDVDLGRFGKIHARFTGNRVKGEPPFPGCNGQRSIEMQGRLEGNLRFRGEDGYVDVSSKRVTASYKHGFREVCKDDTNSHPRRDLVNVLYATGTTAGHEVRFSAIYQEIFGTPSISASILERIGRVLALKISAPIDEGSRLEFSPPRGRPQTATVAPTLPFSGSASYVARPDGSSEWIGDLQVSFAGLGEVALTGPGFQAVACRPRLPNVRLDCKDGADAS